jgi:hypothetical protein
VRPGRGAIPKRASIAALLAGVMLALLSLPGQPIVGNDPRAILCGSDCFPVAYPWLLTLGVAAFVGGLVGLKIALRRALK